MSISIGAMTFVFKEIEQKDYEALSRGVGVPLTQNAFYGEWQVVLGKRVWRYSVGEGGIIFGFFQVIKYLLPIGNSYLYVPHGPIFIEEVSDELLAALRRFFCELLTRERSVFLRFDPTWKLSFQVVDKKLFERYFFKAASFSYNGNFQPKYEWVIDLFRDEGEILASMKKVNRYSIGHAERYGFTTMVLDKNFLEYLDKFYELIKVTAKRDKFLHHSKEYYGRIFKECEEAQNGFLVIVSFAGEVVLINFFVTYGDTAFFLFSGSRNEYRRSGYTYLAQWVAIKHSKKLGLRYYNFGAGIPENNKYFFYKSWQGFSDFKKRFGGSLVEYSDFYDVVYDKFWYVLYVYDLRKAFVLFWKRLFSI